jgi:hypothetical protein
MQIKVEPHQYETGADTDVTGCSAREAECLMWHAVIDARIAEFEARHPAEWQAWMAEWQARHAELEAP